MTRKDGLVLRREVLAALSDDELGDVAGGTVRITFDCSHPYTVVCISVRCLTETCL